MFVRISDIARKIALISLLVSLPLLLIAGVLLGNLSNLLLLNERRKLGLLRLRGVSGRAIGATLLLAIGLGGLDRRTGSAPCSARSCRSRSISASVPPLELIPKIQEPLYLGLFLVVGIAIALATGRRLVREASRVSPLEASRRVSRSRRRIRARALRPAAVPRARDRRRQVRGLDRRPLADQSDRAALGRGRSIAPSILSASRCSSMAW